MPNGWRTINSLVHKIRLHGRRGKGMAESFSRQKSRHAPQKEGGLKILCDLPPVWPRLVRPTNLMSRMDGKKTHTHCRESVGTGPVVLKAVRVTGAAFASPRTKCYCAPLFSHTHYCCGDAKAAPVTRTALRTTGPVPTDSRQCSNNNYVLKSNIYDDTVSCALNFLHV